MAEMTGTFEQTPPIDRVWIYIGHDLGLITKRLKIKGGAIRLDDVGKQKYLQDILTSKNINLAREYLETRRCEWNQNQENARVSLKAGFPDDQKYWKAKKERAALEGKQDPTLRARRGELRHQMNETQRGQTLTGMESTAKQIQEVDRLLTLLPPKTEQPKYPSVPPEPPKTHPLVAVAKNILGK